MPFEMPRRRWLAIGVALLVLSACGLGASPVLSKVVVDQLQTDLVFGAGQPSPPPAQPPAQGLGLSQPFIAPFEGLPFTPFEGGGLCPTAPSTAFPAEEAPSDVTVMPAPGQYNWVGGGTYDYTPLPTLTVKIPVTPFFTEYVRRVATLPASTLPGLPAPVGATGPSLNFTFQTLAPQIGNVKGGFYVFSWQVKSKAGTGDSEPGLVLKRVDTVDTKGSSTGTVFDSGTGPGLLLLPLPASPGPVGLQTPNGNLSDSFSVDTSGSGNSLTFSGNVGPRERVDACGTWLQAWPVDGSLTNGSATAKIHLDVATQFGAILVAFNIDGGFFGNTLNKVTTHAGQTAPSALPQQWQ